MTWKRWIILAAGLVLCAIIILSALLAFHLNRLYRPKSITEGPVEEAWVARYDGPTHHMDSASTLCVDEAGSVYVTGTSHGKGTDADYAIVKYDSDGKRLWVARYDGPAHGQDIPSATAVDASGSVYVTGESPGTDVVPYSTDDACDYATLKYAPDGDQLWVARYSGSASRYDSATAIAVDASGNVYVTGYTTVSGNHNDWSNYHSDYVTIKYDADGNQLWLAQYEGAGGVNEPCAIALDGSSNVYVAGSTGQYGGINSWTIVKYDANGNEIWVTRHDGFVAKAMATDGAGNVYVTGSDGNDCCTAGYDSHGSEMWVARYHGPARNSPSGDVGKAIAVDRLGEIYVTGDSYQYRSYSGQTDYAIPQTDYATLKYGASGNQLWVARYSSAHGDSEAAAVAVDESGNVYVTGSSHGLPRYTSVKYYATVKYDANGNQVWLAQYSGTADGYSEAAAIAVDDTGNLYVTGYSPRITGVAKLKDFLFGGWWDVAMAEESHDYTTIKYKQP